MDRLIDASLWVDFTRARTPRPLREQVRAFVDAPDACLCDPVAFELLRAAAPAERPGLERRFETMYWLPLPPGFWRKGIRLGQHCRDHGFTIGALDLLIATAALAHDAEIVTFDADYSLIAQAEPKLRVQVLTRAQ
ncbi:MAG TPA: PIN domain-containing protein [Chthoniobacteraceae bacterium]|jgi:predicted nucleic acid-binding protein|nr:PIN domain-containing protein [Chthoniobacteraceae bacterium]